MFVKKKMKGVVLVICDGLEFLTAHVCRKSTVSGQVGVQFDTLSKDTQGHSEPKAGGPCPH